ncbi:hypothetical protein [Streptomyces sp. IB201691-2A2]|uniref:hypothetical protein n=1 Tax=Streptomyces sp. IB201691-2A2 TaxID=2561920 RepID=UPI00117CCB0C|nr:hypothetical protein [Streptomyces sp. IB201691-2A2]TRO59948.1 hypothetical protein E4K73_33090 [Streptomyces sp. IB201691-2A2]
MAARSAPISSSWFEEVGGIGDLGHGDKTSGDPFVGMLAAQLIGVTFTRYFVEVGRFAEMSADEPRVHLSLVLRQILFT